MNCLEPITLNKLMSDGVRRRITVPCGKCILCEKKRANDFARRAVDELQFWNESCVVTLTYNDAHLPPNGLKRRDVQLFSKRLRKYLGDVNVKIYGCGEYGDLNGRPHYHLIIYGWCPKDLVFRYIKKGRKHYISDVLQRLWSVYKGNDHYNRPIFDPIGYCDVCKVVDIKTCFYCAKYLQKRAEAYLPADYPHSFMITPREGLGKRAVNNNMLKQAMLGGTMYRNGKKVPIPRYYRNQLVKQFGEWVGDWFRIRFLKSQMIYKKDDEVKRARIEEFDKLLR
ncbi:replication initiator protein [Sigmofec virus UA08Rod_6488]|uniref:Replication initiator protein n=1 Tax=Sigmofec virus UA08Rod_6488 TaxID=2929232 RepID=A0A976N0D2_9VIRU|nr:replication initiator protein [Sigmofec virus UA08Rod_6488]